MDTAYLSDSQRYLLMLHLGPVQDWIAQARRTRDSWFGSHYLSEISKAAAKRLHREGAQLVFPAQRDDRALEQALEPWDTPWIRRCDPEAPEGRQPPVKPAFNVANKVVAVVQGDPRKLAREAREAAKERWNGIVGHTLHSRRCKELIVPNRQALIDEQRDTLLEFYAVWSELPSQGYGEVFADLARALDARKQLREFKRWDHDTAGEYRSSLDGARASILKRPPKPKATDPASNALRKARARLRIAKGEHLDAVGLTKRAGGGPGQFVPLVNVALARWIICANTHCGEALKSLRIACKALEGPGGSDGLERIYRPDLKWTAKFPFDAHLFHEERWEILLQEMQERAADGAPVQELKTFRPWCERHVRPVLRRMSAPPAYVACIIADGDRMGETLKQLSIDQQHRIFSRELSKFACEGRKLVEHTYHGSLVFSGGDDVFGWVPVEAALPCAGALRETFSRIMKDALDAALELQGAAAGAHRILEPPTLSVGIGIGHAMEAMGTLINLARDAEKLAKGNALPRQQQRNALAVMLDKRSGGLLEWRAPWKERPLARLEDDLDLIRSGGLSIGKIHELRTMHRKLPEPKMTPAEDEAAFHTLLVLELDRILARNEGRGGSREQAIRPGDLGIDATTATAYAELHQVVRDAVDRLLLAVHLRQQPAGTNLDADGAPAISDSERSTGGDR